MTGVRRLLAACAMVACATGAFAQSASVAETRARRADLLTARIDAARAAADHVRLADLYSERSRLFSEAGRLADALSDAELAHAAAAKVSERGEVTALAGLAQAQSQIANVDQAIRLWTEVIERYRTMGPAIGVAVALDARGHLHYDAEHFAESLADARAAIDAYTALNLRPPGRSYARAGLASIRLGRDTDARQWLADAAARIGSAPETEQVQTWALLGMAYVLLGDVAPATHAFSQVVALGRKRRDTEEESRGEFGLGRAALAAHDPETAIDHFQRAVELIETLRTDVAAQLRAAYAARRVEAYEWLTAALMQQSASPGDAYVERAFNAAERARVRTLNILLAEGRLLDESPSRPRATVRTRGDIARTLGPGDVIMEYLVGEEFAYGFALTAERLIGFDLPSPVTLDTSVRHALAYIDADDRDGLARIGEELTPALLGPLLERIQDFQRLIIVADGSLRRLPFAALPLPNAAYLAQRIAVSNASAASSLASRQQSLRGDTLLALASHHVDGARQSGDVGGGISDALRMLAPPDGGQIIEATTDRFTQAASAGYRIIHIAADTRIDERSSRNSAIVLRSESEGERELRVADISHLPITADLVVLAASRTQRGGVLRGEGLLSLTEALRASGAQRVVTSLWDVGDHETREMLRGLYAGIAAGLAVDQALRMAQLQMLRAGGSLASPKVWAAFQVSGDARPPAWSPHPPSRTAFALTAAMLAAIAIALTGA